MNVVTVWNPRLVLIFLWIVIFFPREGISQSEIVAALDDPNVVVLEADSGWDVASTPVLSGESSVASPFLNEIVGSKKISLQVDGPAFFEVAYRIGSDNGTVNVKFSSEAWVESRVAHAQWQIFRLYVPSDAHSISCEVFQGEEHDQLVLDAVKLTEDVPSCFPLQGGMILLESDTLELLMDTAVFLTAFPSPGWEFDHWGGSKMVTDNQLFASTGWSDVAPKFSKYHLLHDREFYSGGQNGPWDLDLETSALVSPQNGGELSTIVQGPAILNIEFDFIPKSNNPIKVFLDLLEVGSIMAPQDSPLEILVPRGEYELRIETGLSQASLVNFDTVRGVRIDHQDVPNGSFETIPDKAVYAIEELVVVNAIPDEGFQFGNWTGDLSGTKKNLKTVLYDHLLVDGVFFDGEISSFPLTFEGESLWTVDSVMKTESGGSTLVAKFLESGESAIVKAEFEGPLTVSFWAAAAESNKSGSGFTFSVDGENLLDDDPPTTGTYYSYELGPGLHELQWRMTRTGFNLATNRTWIGDILIGSGFGLNVSSIGDGKVEVSPEKRLYLPGEVVTLKAIPDEGSTFAGWYGDLFVSDDEISVVMNTTTSLEAYFESSVLWGDRTWKLGGLTHMSLEEGGGPNGEVAWSHSESEASFNAWVESEWEGPGLLQFQLLFNQGIDNSTTVSVNGETVLQPFLTEEWMEYSISLEPGLNRVRWRLEKPFEWSAHEDWKLSDIHFEEGNSLLVDVADGSVLQDPEGGVFPSVVEVDLQIVEPETWDASTGWLGTVEFSDLSLNLTMDQNHRLYHRIGKSVEFEGLSFITSPIAPWIVGPGPGLEPEAFIQVESNSETFNKDTWLAAEVEGPGVLYFDYEQYGISFLHLNGKPVEMLGRKLESPYQVSVPFGPGTNYVEVNNGVLDGLSGLRLNQFYLESGYRIASDIKGANLSVQPEGEFFEPGTDVSLELNVHPGNRFEGWVGSLSGTETSIDLTVEDHLSLNVVAQLEELGFGDSFLTSSNSVWYWQDEYAEADELALRGDGVYGRNGDMNLDVVVEGPGVVQYSEFRPEGMDWFPIEFYIDLDLVKPDYYWNNGLNSFTAQSVGPGYHRLRWLSEDDSDGNSVFLENLNFVSGDVVAFTMDHSAEDFGFGVAESSVEQGAVVKGQPITFTAIPGEHLEFLYWVIGEEIFRENPFEYRPQSDIHVEPYFGLRYQEAEYEVSADEFNNSPENPDFSVKIVDDVIELSASDFNGRIFLRRRNIERSHVLFEWQGKEGGSQYMQFYLDDVFRAHPHANVEPEDIVDGWTHFSHLTEIHDGSLPNSVMLACGLNTLVAGPSGLSIRNLRMASNLGLEVEPEGGGIVSDPDLSFFSLGSTVTIEAVPDEGNRFIGWGGSMDGHENPIQILVAPHTEIRAFFGKETVHDYDGISWVHDGSGQVNFGTHFHYNYWASVSGIPPGAQATLSTTIEGPAAVLFQSQDLSEVELRVLVDGELAELKDVPFAFTPEYQLFIGAGPHVLTYEIINSDPFNEGIYEIRDFRLDPGWKVNIDAPGGDFVVLPEKENYEYGEMVHISAIAPERSRFLGWTGVLEGENKYVSQLLNDHIVSTARFLRAVSFSGFDWESEETLPWDVNEFGLYCPDTNNIRYSGGASVSTEVVGPGTINIELGGGHISQYYSPRLEIWLDGEFVDAYQKDGSIIPEQYRVPLLAGQHTLEVRNVVYSLPNGAEVFEAGSIKSIAYEIEESDAARRSYLSQFISREALNSLSLESLKDDEDGDGIPFVLEQWLNSNPFSADMQWPVELEASVDAEGNTCVYLESHLFSELYEGTFEVSGDLSTWFTVPSDEIVMDRISLNESVDLLKLKLPNTGNEPKVFLRVR